MVANRSFGSASVAAAATALLQISSAVAAYTRPNAEECQQTVNFKEYAQEIFPDEVCDEEKCSYKVKRGSTFKMEYRPTYKVLSFGASGEVDGMGPLESATYILYQCSQTKPDDAFIKSLNTSETHFVEVPVTAVATEDTSVGWMLEELEVQDRVRFAGKDSTAPCMSKIAFPGSEGGCDRPFIGEYGVTDTKPMTEVTEFDVEFGFSGNTTKKQVYFQSAADPDPLGRAEKLLYLSAFFNKEAAALKYYTGVQEKYAALSTPPSESSPTVAWVTTGNVTFFDYKNADGELLEDNAVTVSFARYKVLLTENAGAKLPSDSVVKAISGAAPQGDDIVFATSEYGSEAAMLEAAAKALAGVDIIIDETYIINPTTATLEGILAAMPGNISAKVWRHDKDQAQTLGGGFADDWFGEGVARPDKVLEDLVGVVSGDPAFTGNFFRNMASPKNITTHSLEECSIMACNAYSNQAPISAAVTPAVAPVSPPTPVTDPSGACSMEGAAAWVVGVAGLVLAAVL